MIRREEPDTTWVIHQAAHAHIAGLIAAHWAHPLPAPRSDLIVAAACHDAGWFIAERAPRVNAQGQPRTFTEMDLEEHFTIWQTSIDAVFAQSRFAALLTSLHCSALYRMRLQHINDSPADQERVQAFLEARDAWETALTANLGANPRYAQAVTPQALDTSLRLLQVWDYLSLLACMSPVREQTLDDVPAENGQRVSLRVAPLGLRGMALAPFPLDEALTVWIEGRRVCGAPFASNAALQEALCDAPYEPLAFAFGPL